MAQEEIPTRCCAGSTVRRFATALMLVAAPGFIPRADEEVLQVRKPTRRAVSHQSRKVARRRCPPDGCPEPAAEEPFEGPVAIRDDRQHSCAGLASAHAADLRQQAGASSVLRS